jgi:hypothetical protein
VAKVRQNIMAESTWKSRAAHSGNQEAESTKKGARDKIHPSEALLPTMAYFL